MKIKCSPLLYCAGKSGSNKMWCNLFILLAVLIISGCATAKDTVVPVTKDTVVLVQDADGKVGQLTVTTRGGAQTLTVPNTGVEVTGSAKSPSDPKMIDQSQIDSLFADSLKALPLEPVSFLLYFLNNLTELTAESKACIPEVLSLFNKREFYEISIIGHTDTTGSDEYNMGLSFARAKAVRDILHARGIRSDQLELRHHGKRDPIVSTGDNVAEPRNRRVEVVVK